MNSNLAAHLWAMSSNFHLISVWVHGKRSFVHTALFTLSLVLHDDLALIGCVAGFLADDSSYHFTACLKKRDENVLMNTLSRLLVSPVTE